MLSSGSEVAAASNRRAEQHPRQPDMIGGLSPQATADAGRGATAAVGLQTQDVTPTRSRVAALGLPSFTAGCPSSGGGGDRRLASRSSSTASRSTARPLAVSRLCRYSASSMVLS